MSFSVTSISNSTHAISTSFAEPVTKHQKTIQDKANQIVPVPLPLPIPAQVRKFKDGHSPSVYSLFHKALSDVLGPYQSQSGYPFPLPLLSLIAEYEDQIITVSSVERHFVSTVGFGKKMWFDYFNQDIGEEPPLPSDIGSILTKRCPFNPEKTVSQTHVLVLVPATLGGEPLTLKKIGELMKGLGKQGYDTVSHVPEFEGHENTPCEASHWILMTKNILDESRNMSYADQLKFADLFPEYSIPNLAEAAVASFMEHLVTGLSLIEHRHFARCRDNSTNGHQVGVGRRSPHGLILVSHLNRASHNMGIALLRKFF